MDTPLISIVMPTYNGSAYLAEAIESCIKQVYTHWELLIVDDASTDSSPDIIKQYIGKDSRIQSVRHAANQGLPSALNTGFEMAKGDYFTWTSDDNLYLPHALSEMLLFLQHHPGVDMVYCDWSLIDQTGACINYVVEDRDELLRDNCVGPCFLYSCRVSKTVGPYATKFSLAEDYDYWLRTSIHFTLRPLHKNLYRYREHSSSLTSLHQHKVKRVAQAALAEHLPNLHWAGAIKRAFAYLNLAIKARARGETIKALRYTGLSIRYAPWLCVLKRSRGLWWRLLRGMQHPDFE